MSWAIAGLFEQTKGKFQKANRSQGENGEPMISEGDCRGNDKAVGFLKGAVIPRKVILFNFFFFFNGKKDEEISTS